MNTVDLSIIVGEKGWAGHLHKGFMFVPESDGSRKVKLYFQCSTYLEVIWRSC